MCVCVCVLYLLFYDLDQYERWNVVDDCAVFFHMYTLNSDTNIQYTIVVHIYIYYIRASSPLHRNNKVVVGGSGGKNNRTRKLSIRTPSFSDRKSMCTCSCACVCVCVCRLVGEWVGELMVVEAVAEKAAKRYAHIKAPESRVTA